MRRINKSWSGKINFYIPRPIVNVLSLIIHMIAGGIIMAIIFVLMYKIFGG